MIRFVILCTCLTAILTACCLTRAEADAVKGGAGTVGTLFGIPRPITEGVVGAALLALGVTGGHKHGRRCERRASRRDENPFAEAVDAPPPRKKG